MKVYFNEILTGQHNILMLSSDPLRDGACIPKQSQENCSKVPCLCPATQARDAFEMKYKRNQFVSVDVLPSPITVEMGNFLGSSEASKSQLKVSAHIELHFSESICKLNK
jgi:hypothetical protein